MTRTFRVNIPTESAGSEIYYPQYRGHVDGSRGFIHDEDAALPDERSGQTEELPLTDAEVLSTFCHHSIYTQFTHLKRTPAAAETAISPRWKMFLPSPPGSAFTMCFS